MPPFNDVRARRALNLAVDRGRLRDLVQGPGLGQVTCQVLPPDFTGYRRYCPYTAEPSPSGAWTAPKLAARAAARSLLGHSRPGSHGLDGEEIYASKPTARYLVSVLDSLGYKARFRIAANPFNNEDKLHLQLGFSGWYPDFASAPSSVFGPILTCGSYNLVNSQNANFAEFCDPTIDREIARAKSLQTSAPEASSRMWAKVDRDITDQAPWVSFANGVVLEVKAARVGNYEFNPQWGTLLDQLWVR